MSSVPSMLPSAEEQEQLRVLAAEIARLKEQNRIITESIMDANRQMQYIIQMYSPQNYDDFYHGDLMRGLQPQPPAYKMKSKAKKKSNVNVKKSVKRARKSLRRNTRG